MVVFDECQGVLYGRIRKQKRERAFNALRAEVSGCSAFGMVGHIPSFSVSEHFAVAILTKYANMILLGASIIEHFSRCGRLKRLWEVFPMVQPVKQ
jgi:hypothetical protein